jgi:hypothetical protein
MAIKNLNVTIGAAATAFTSASIRCNWFTVTNRDSSAMAIGGSDTAVGSQGKGIPLAANGSYTVQRPYNAQSNLAYWYVAGTQGQILSVVYDDAVDNLA